MPRFDHLAIAVRDLDAARAWYVDKLGLEVEFEIPDRRTIAVKDTHDFTIFLVEGEAPQHCGIQAFWYQVDDVRTAFADLSRKGVRFNHPPQKTFWGFGPEAVDPDGYLVRLWDERSMKEES